MAQFDLDSAVQRVTDYTLAHPYERDVWEKSPAITGILMWNDEAAVAQARQWVDRMVDVQSSRGYLGYDERIELANGHAAVFTPTAALSTALAFNVLAYYERDGDARLLQAAKRQAQALLAGPRTRNGGFWVRKEGPELWIDFIYMMCPFLARLGRIEQNPALIDEALKQIDVYVRHLVDPELHLARHAWRETPDSYLQSTFWCRGNGWLTCCLVDTIEQIGTDHAGAARLKDLGRRVFEAIAAHQDRCGFFHNILDDENAKFEASGTVMFAYSAAKAVNQGWLDAGYIEKAERALRIVAGSIEADGAIPGVQVPPGGPGVPFATTLYGQGFFIQAAAELRHRLR
ncbi:Unsaturated rhamnogalacturonyl hydrolase YteR [Variovorax sp. PBL-H6]|uniref:glycoside hydrolase family 88 protein n=1 Tax=Variovorax sp. PBL-H6 TaxID=434009 RepID=UPI0013194452|nr:glycoside hydrolase family 88 protein [Variovorax sp. PBL-H6]VTU37999.1 Unsaturated rhamnogalacturonyl hydrolase YteR [Variovorax sp. PBL-H6]